MSFYRILTVFVNGFWASFGGSMLHKCLVRLWYFPSILRMTLMAGPKRHWYDRIDSTVVLGALPFRSQTKKLVETENVGAVLSFNEAYELNFFTNTKQEWAVHGVQQEWFPTVDLLPPSLLDIGRGLKVIQDCKVKCKSVYVHCKAGKGRSATVTACYLIKDYGYAPTEAIEHMRFKRPQVTINPRQRKRIVEFYEELQSKKKL